MLNWKLMLGAIIGVSVTMGSLKVFTLSPVVETDTSARPSIENEPQVSAAPAPTEWSDSALAGLAEMIEWEAAERIRLQQQVDELEERLARIESPAGERAARVPSADQQFRGQDDGVTEAALIAAGFTKAEAAYYRRRNDEAAMAQLYLRDQAEREGWIRTPRYFEALQEIRSDLESIRNEMDDDAYARYLYAVGRPNQVTVRRVLSGSAAEIAGLQPGDILIGYEGSRIFAASEVRRATRDGNAGDTVTLEVLRDGQRIQTYVPRGPLGISMSSDSVLPPDS
jgi:C-terminal processing protease CtpA/Prc